MHITVRPALPSELEWVNAHYASIDFLLSTPADRQLIILVDDEVAGLGRIVPTGPDSGELGGMYVFDRYQGLGLSRRLVESLQTLPGFASLFCLPFSKLEKLYASCGFASIACTPALPEHVVQKYQWCNAHYGEPVLLMRWDRA